jgi:hypothetical protein
MIASFLGCAQYEDGSGQTTTEGGMHDRDLKR